MIQINKRYRTRDGNKVQIEKINDYNVYGKKTTFPVQGFILNKDKSDFCIWTITGAYLPGQHPHPNDLI